MFVDVFEGVHLDVLFEHLEQRVQFVTFVHILLVQHRLLDELVSQIVYDLLLVVLYHQLQLVSIMSITI